MQYGDEPSAKTRLATLNTLYFLNMAIRQNKTSGIDTLMQEMEAQAAEQQETIVTTEQIETLKRLNGTLRESIVELKDAKYRVDDAREVCEDIYKRLWGICDGVHAALLRAENLRLKAHIDEKEVKKLSQFAESLRAAEEQLLERHLEKQKELWHTSLPPAPQPRIQRRHLALEKSLPHLALVLPPAALLHHHLNLLLSGDVVWVGIIHLSCTCPVMEFTMLAYIPL